MLATSTLGALAAPLLLPSLWWASWSGAKPARWIAGLAAGVVAAEATVLVTVLVVRGNGLELMGASVDWSRRWLLPVSVGMATTAMYIATAARAQHGSGERALDQALQGPSAPGRSLAT